MSIKAIIFANEDYTLKRYKPWRLGYNLFSMSTKDISKYKYLNMNKYFSTDKIDLYVKDSGSEQHEPHPQFGLSEQK